MAIIVLVDLNNYKRQNLHGYQFIFLRTASTTPRVNTVRCASVVTMVTQLAAQLVTVKSVLVPLLNHLTSK